MLKSVLIGLLVLVVCVFAYVGYSGYSTGRGANRDLGADGRPRVEIRAEPSGAGAAASTLPTMPTTGEASGNGLVAQGGAAAAGAMPSSDSIAANPPNGMTFGGSGHYQLYRQGDLTWRLNTDDGQTCVIFATDEEWRKPKVYRSGCRGR